jgi:hypothetical protein
VALKQIQKLTKQEPKIPRRLSPWNPLDQLRLFWWTLLSPQQLIDYRETYGDEDEERVGKWLLSSLAWWPLLVPTLALGLEQLPPPDKPWLLEVYQFFLQHLSHLEAWLPAGFRPFLENLPAYFSAWLTEIYLLFSVLLIICWLLTGGWGHKSKESLIVNVAAGLAIIIAVGVITSVAVVVAVVVAICAALGVMISVQSGVGGEGLAKNVARGVELGVVYDVIFELSNGLTMFLTGVVLAIIFMFLVAGGVRVTLENGLETGTPTTTARLIFLYFVFVHILLILLCFLGGSWVWRV